MLCIFYYSILLFYYYATRILYYRYACAITDKTTDSVIITGGVLTARVVSRYDMQGHVEDLPEMIQGRVSHACGHYHRVDGIMVSRVSCFSKKLSKLS